MKYFFAPLLDPLGAIWLLMVVSFVWLLWRRQWRSATLLGLPISLIFIFGSTPIIERLVEVEERPYAVADLTTLPPADAVVVLGASFQLVPCDPLGFSVGDTGARLLPAIQLIRLGKAQALVLGGGRAYPGHPGESQMVSCQQWIEKWQLTSVPVTNLGICGVTYDEAVNYKELCASHHWKRTILVTTALHLKRAEAVFKKQGLDIVPVGCDFQRYGILMDERNYRPFPSQERFNLWSLYLHEKIGWWVYKYRGWI
jgi:uncharacterized SAM-binding protein YcdF (DUF218 family)